MFPRLIDAGRFWKFLMGILAGSSIKQAWEAVASPFCLEAGYKLLACFIRNQSVNAVLKVLFFSRSKKSFFFVIG